MSLEDPGSDSSYNVNQHYTPPLDFPLAGVDGNCCLQECWLCWYSRASLAVGVPLKASFKPMLQVRRPLLPA